MDVQQSQPAPDAPKRVTVVFAPQTYRSLTYLSESKGISHAEALRQAIRLAEYLSRAQNEDGAKIWIDRGGKLSEFVLY